MNFEEFHDKLAISLLIIMGKGLKTFFKSAFYLNIIKKTVAIHREVKFSANFQLI